MRVIPNVVLFEFVLRNVKAIEGIALGVRLLCSVQDVASLGYA